MKLGFIGMGNMAGAIMGGIIAKGVLKPEEIIGAEPLQSVLDQVAARHGIEVTTDNKKVASEADVLILSVKPQIYPAVIAEIKSIRKPDQLIITIAAGKKLAWVEEQFGEKRKIIRTMPNTPALVGEGMTAVCPNDAVTEEDLQTALKLLGAFGKVEVVKEHLMDAVVSVSGSSPAYVFMMIEAMADAAVSDGMPRAQAYKFAAQAVLGSAKMVLETGKHPAELKDMVCSPAGTTIEAVRVLEERGFRSSIIEAMKACAEVSRSL